MSLRPRMNSFLGMDTTPEHLFNGKETNILYIKLPPVKPEDALRFDYAKKTSCHSLRSCQDKRFSSDPVKLYFTGFLPFWGEGEFANVWVGFTPGTSHVRL